MKIPQFIRSQSSAFEKEEAKADDNNGNSSSTLLKPVTHVIFDVDGTLLDTVGIYGEVLGKVLKRHNKKVSWEFSVSTLGMRREETMAKIVSFYDLPYTPEQLSEELFGLTLKKLSKAFLMEGAERLVNHLYRHKVSFETVLNLTLSK
jgi:pseudouridine-5'-monophosphatase